MRIGLGRLGPAEFPAGWTGGKRFHLLMKDGVLLAVVALSAEAGLVSQLPKAGGNVTKKAVGGRGPTARGKARGL